MKVFICLALFALIAAAYASDEKAKVPEAPKDKPADAPKREGRYLLVANRGLYDNYNRQYVVVGTPAYSEYARSYYYWV